MLEKLKLENHDLTVQCQQLNAQRLAETVAAAQLCELSVEVEQPEEEVSDLLIELRAIQTSGDSGDKHRSPGTPTTTAQVSKFDDSEELQSLRQEITELQNEVAEKV